jgi:hypothetical protein
MYGQPNFNASHIYCTNKTVFNRHTIHKYPMHTKNIRIKKIRKKSQINSQNLVHHHSHFPLDRLSTYTVKLYILNIYSSHCTHFGIICNHSNVREFSLLPYSKNTRVFSPYMSSSTTHYFLEVCLL